MRTHELESHACADRVVARSPRSPTAVELGAALRMLPRMRLRLAEVVEKRAQPHCERSPHPLRPARPQRCARRAAGASVASCSKPIACSNSGRSAVRTPVSRARRSARAGSAPSSSFESSPMPSEPAHPPRARRRRASRTLLRRASAAASTRPARTRAARRSAAAHKSQRVLGEARAATPCEARRSSRSAALQGGSTKSPVASRRAIAFTVKSRRPMSSSTESDGSATISKSCRPGPVLHLLARGGANSIPRVRGAELLSRG